MYYDEELFDFCEEIEEQFDKEAFHASMSPGRIMLVPFDNGICGPDCCWPKSYQRNDRGISNRWVNRMMLHGVNAKRKTLRTHRTGDAHKSVRKRRK